MSSAICFNLGQTKTLSSGKWLIYLAELLCTDVKCKQQIKKITNFAPEWVKNIRKKENVCSKHISLSHNV